MAVETGSWIEGVVVCNVSAEGVGPLISVNEANGSEDEFVLLLDPCTNGISLMKFAEGAPGKSPWSQHAEELPSSWQQYMLFPQASVRPAWLLLNAKE